MQEKKQKINKWWAENPMTYGTEHGQTIYNKKTEKIDFQSKDFFENADRQFIGWNKPLHTETASFSKIFPYEKYKNKNILEIGCGMGYMAMLWAQNQSNVIATDLNPVAVDQTKHRFNIFNLKGKIQQEDANNLSFKNNFFDYVYSWGVLHHSPNIEKSISELFRVLKPSSEYGVMLYNRHSLLFWYHVLYLEGFLHKESKFLNKTELANRYSDGHRDEGNPHTWPITQKEAKILFSKHSTNVKTKLFGTDLDSTFKFLLPGLGYVIPKFVKKSWARRFGWSVWIYGKKD
jgi:ubiquinone/menaquinone biosynthesis C-methylase UbiE